MADIELVIKIPEETYKKIQSCDWKNGGRWFSEEWKAIHNGIPLPEGHGRLIDATDLLKMTNNYKVVKYGVKTVERIIRDAPTIIEAEKAESEDKE